MMLCETFLLCGLSLKIRCETVYSWEVNEVLHYVGWQATQNGAVWLVSMILEAFSYMSL